MKIWTRSSVVFMLLMKLLYADANTRPDPLHLVYPQESSLQNPVTVQLTLGEKILHVNFEVHTPEIYAKKQLKSAEYPYQYDVVEVFIATSKNTQNLPVPYYEFELSPFDQSLQVKVITPFKQVIKGIDMGVQHSVARFPGGWRAEMLIPMENLGWDGDRCSIVGNAFAILGKPPRSFWSLYLPHEDKPNFHKPEYFKPLLC